MLYYPQHKGLAFLALLDAIKLLTYFIFQLTAFKIPLYSDLLAVIRNAQFLANSSLFSSVSIITLGVLNLVLYLSLFASIYVFWRALPISRWIALGQFPLRILTLTCSIPFTGSFFALLGNFWLMLAVLFLVEIAKVGYVWETTQKD